MQKETQNGSLNRKLANTTDDDKGGGNDEEGSGTQNFGNSAAVNSSINSFRNG